MGGDDDLVLEGGRGEPTLNDGLLGRLRSGPVPSVGDVEAAIAMARLAHDQLTHYGTDGEQWLAEDEVRNLLRALGIVAGRLGISVKLPFRDFSSFRTWWVRNGAHGSWQARRELLSELFDPLHDELATMEDRSLARTLATPVSPREATGWPLLDQEIEELKRHFRNARTAADYRAVGLDCVAVTEALSRTVYDPERHLRDGETEPSPAQTKQRLDRFVEDAAPGRENAALRKLVKATIELAQEVKHRGSPSRREAGIAADSVILLSNLLRRLAEPREDETTG